VGTNDLIIPPAKSKTPLEKSKFCGTSLTRTYKEADHLIWGDIYCASFINDWLFEQQKPPVLPHPYSGISLKIASSQAQNCNEIVYNLQGLQKAIRGLQTAAQIIFHTKTEGLIFSTK